MRGQEPQDILALYYTVRSFCIGRATTTHHEALGVTIHNSTNCTTHYRGITRNIRSDEPRGDYYPTMLKTHCLRFQETAGRSDCRERL